MNIGGDKKIGRSVRRSVFVCVYTMTHHHLHMSYTTDRNGGALLWKLLHLTVVMFKSLRLAEICTLTSAERILVAFFHWQSQL